MRQSGVPLGHEGVSGERHASACRYKNNNPFHGKDESCRGNVNDKKMCDKKMQFIFLPPFFCLDCLLDSSVLSKLGVRLHF